MAENSEGVARSLLRRGNTRRQSHDPPSAQYLSKRDTKYTCYFLVGNPDLGPLERIGGCKLHLMAHSKVMRRMLGESRLAEKGDVKLPDIEPEPFRHVLRFVNGQRDLRYLTLEEEVDMVYVAEKYLMDELKEALAEHIVSQLNTDTVFLLLQQPECLETPALKAAIEKIVQYDTNTLLAKEEFLDINSFGLLSILKQEALAVTEIELWRAVLKWAKSYVQTQEDVRLRDLLNEPLKHVRLCTLDILDFTGDVVMAGVLTDREVHLVLRAISSSTVQAELTSVCSNVTRRRLMVPLAAKSVPACAEFNVVLGFDTFLVTGKKHDSFSSSSYLLLTHDVPVELIHVKVPGCVHDWSLVPKGLKYKSRCSIFITRITDYSNDSSSEHPLEFKFCKDVEYGQDFTIPFKARGKNVKLSANNKFRVLLSFNVDHPYFWQSVRYQGNMLSVVCEERRSRNAKGCFHGCHIKEISCKPAPK